MPHSQIPVEKLNITTNSETKSYSTPLLENEIAGIKIEQVTLASKSKRTDSSANGAQTIYLFVEGSGQVIAAGTRYEIVPETILLPNIVPEITIEATHGRALHYLKITTELTAQDQLDLKEFPTENTQTVYYAKFTDCQPYIEPIKSPNTVSRTILPNKYIPRIAMGTVQTTGPDQVGAHKHPMLEQLFLGLSNNNCTVFADDAEVNFPQYSLLHIPLGSTHSVAVEAGEVMTYVWMDFFLDKEGESWLKTHQHIDDVG